MATKPNLIAPLHIQVKGYLDQLLDRGELKAGDRLPSEKELELQFGVSRITVRHALQALASEDRIVRIPGKGSYVREPKVEPLTALTSFSENMRARGRTPSYTQTQVELVEAPASAASALALSPGQRALHIHRLMLADGLPMAIQDAYLPEHIHARNPLLFERDVLDNVSMYKVLEIELGIKLFRAEEQVDAAIAQPAEAKDLATDADEVVLIVKRTTYDIDGKPVEYVKLVFPTSRYRYKVELFRPSRHDSR